MIASLPMYDLPPLQAANDRFWEAIRKRLGEGPDQLTRDGDLWNQWQSADLLLSQTCGFPYRAKLHGHVTLVGTPDYGLQDCLSGYYCSVFVARADDARTTLREFGEARFAFNEPMSQSGWAAPAHHVSGLLGFAFADVVQTGGHAASARAVAEGRADLTAIDAQTWRLLKQHDSFTDALREVDRTVPTPVLPYITAKGRDPAPIFDAIAWAIEDLSREDAALLGLRGIVSIPADAYLAVPTPAPPPTSD